MSKRLLLERARQRNVCVCAAEGGAGGKLIVQENKNRTTGSSCVLRGRLPGTGNRPLRCRDASALSKLNRWRLLKLIKIK